MSAYDPRYLAGIVLFNEREFFEAHEVWEDLWSEAHGVERKFYQGLIQAAVGLCHFVNGNLGGAVKLYHSSRGYLEPCGTQVLGLDLPGFLRQMDKCFHDLLANSAGRIEFDPQKQPLLQLDPEPESWPDPARYLPEDES